MCPFHVQCREDDKATAWTLPWPSSCLTVVYMAPIFDMHIQWNQSEIMVDGACSNQSDLTILQPLCSKQQTGGIYASASSISQIEKYCNTAVCFVVYEWHFGKCCFMESCKRLISLRCHRGRLTLWVAPQSTPPHPDATNPHTYTEHSRFNWLLCTCSQTDANN